MELLVDKMLLFGAGCQVNRWLEFGWHSGYHGKSKEAKRREEVKTSNEKDEKGRPKFTNGLGALTRRSNVRLGIERALEDPLLFHTFPPIKRLTGGELTV